ncbi:hypothetical protein MP638_005134 [Amoeboaphelidium occidentale]|nr:hypothetical protein MP638_005134 [Amoeboaphelidium occidentale]
MSQPQVPSYEELLEEIKALKLRVGQGFLIEKGFPPLGRHVRTMSSTPGSYTTKPRKEFVVKQGAFNILSKFKLETLPNDAASQLWQTAQTNIDKNLGDWTNKADVKTHVIAAFTDCFLLAGLDNELKISTEVPLTSALITGRQTVDLGIIRSVSGSIVGFVEIKRPSVNSIETDKRSLTRKELLAQTANYLFELGYSFGVAYPIGIVTNYRTWTVCWLKETIGLAGETGVDKFKPSSPGSLEIAEVEPPYYHGPVMTHNDPKTVEMFVTALQKMSLVSTQFSHIDVFERQFVIATKNSFSWGKLQKMPFTYTMPAENTRNFVVVHSYHHGGDGRVWWSFSKKGKATLWKKIWMADAAFCCPLNGQSVIVIPFAWHCRPLYDDNDKVSSIRFSRVHDWVYDQIGKSPAQNIVVKEDEELEKCLADFDPVKVAFEAIVTMADAGYKHEDLEWRHVALLPISKKRMFDKVQWSLRPILIDLTRHSSVKNKDHVKQQMDYLISQLEDSLCRSFKSSYENCFPNDA